MNNEGTASDSDFLELIFEACKPYNDQPIGVSKDDQSQKKRFYGERRKRAFSTSETSKFDSTRGRRLQEFKNLELTQQNTFKNDKNIDNVEEMQDEYVPHLKQKIPSQFEFYDKESILINDGTENGIDPNKTSELKLKYDTAKSFSPSERYLIDKLHTSAKPIRINGKENVSAEKAQIDRKEGQRISWEDPFSTNIKAVNSNSDSNLISSLPYNFSSMSFSQRNSVLNQLLPDELKDDTDYRNHIVKLIRRHSIHQDKPSSTAISFLDNFSLGDNLIPKESGNLADSNEVGSLIKGRWLLGDIFNRGTFGIIRNCLNINSKSDKRAIKIIAVHNSAQFIQRFETEAVIWSLMHHRNILELQDICLTKDYFFLVMPKVTGGCLYDTVKMWEACRIPLERRFDQILRFLEELDSALEYIHSKGIYHGDLKLENCLIDSQHGNRLLLCDFGMANFFGDGTSGSIIISSLTKQILHDSPVCSKLATDQSSKSCKDFALPDDEIGSLPYAAPELLVPEAHRLDDHCDIWAFGVVIYTLITLKLPFCHNFEPRMRVQIIQCQYNIRYYTKQLNMLKNTHITSCMRDLLEKCLSLKPMERPDAKHISKILSNIRKLYEEYTPR